MAGSYLAKNTNWTRNFLEGTSGNIIYYIMDNNTILFSSLWSLVFFEHVHNFAGFAKYEFRLPKSYHGTDNGAIHVGWLSSEVITAF
ncbi:hypothetical protein COOONC_04984 [Cooperia oncophora]